MFNFHLSRFLSGNPPVPTVQQINAWAHREPYDKILYYLYWFFALGFFAPIIAMALLPTVFLFEMAWKLLTSNDQQVEPKYMIQTDGSTTQLAVLITGCDSGIGKELAICLASEGFVVFAGCLKAESFEHFKDMGSLIHPILLDVTSDDQVQSCHKIVQQWLSDGEVVKEKRYLHALVNNAGVGVAGYFDWLDLLDYELCMNGESSQSRKKNINIVFLWPCSLDPTHYIVMTTKVNLFGLIRMTKMFLPLLKKQSISGTYKYAQIVNMISLAGMISGTGLGASAYESSKHAAEAFTNSLRLELKMFGIRVVALNPSFFDTPLTNNVRQRVLTQTMTRLSPERKEEYGEGAFKINFLEVLDGYMYCRRSYHHP